jgi:hypothetical protein
MACYAIPLIAAVIHYGLRMKVTGLKVNRHHLWLNLLLAGGAIFGLVDHLWNGELLLISENLLMDLMLGVAITTTLLIVWAVFVVLEKRNVHKTPSSN